MDGHVQPGDYGSDYGEYAINNFLENNWQYAELVYLIEGDEVEEKLSRMEVRSVARWGSVDNSSSSSSKKEEQKEEDKEQEEKSS